MNFPTKIIKRQMTRFVERSLPGHNREPAAVARIQPTPLVLPSANPMRAHHRDCMRRSAEPTIHATIAARGGLGNVRVSEMESYRVCVSVCKGGDPACLSPAHSHNLHKTLSHSHVVQSSADRSDRSRGVRDRSTRGGTGVGAAGQLWGGRER